MADKLTATDYKKANTRKRRKNDQKHEDHLRDLAENTKTYKSLVYPCDADGDYTNNPDEIAYYKKDWRSKDRSKYLKQKCNKQVRGDDEELLQGGDYKKVSDFWWEYY